MMTRTTGLCSAEKCPDELNWTNEIEERNKLHNIDLKDMYSVIEKINKKKWKEIIYCKIYEKGERIISNNNKKDSQ